MPSVSTTSFRFGGYLRDERTRGHRLIYTVLVLCILLVLDVVFVWNLMGIRVPIASDVSQRDTSSYYRYGPRGRRGIEGEKELGL